MNGHARTLTVVGLVLLTVVGMPVAGAGTWSTGNGTTNSVDAAPSFVTVQTSVNPAQPSPGESFDVVTTLANGADSEFGYSITELSVRKGRDDDSESLATLDDVGRLDPGQEVSVSPSVELDDEGVHTLYVHAELTAAGGETHHVIAPVRVRVYRPSPLLEATATPADAGQGRTLSVTVANGLQERIREVSLRLDGESVTFDGPRRVVARIGAGSERTLSFAAESDSLGRKQIEATLTYTTADGTRRTTNVTLTPVFEAAADEGEDEVTGAVQVSADAATGLPGTRVNVSVQVVNGLSTPVRQYELTLESDSLTVEQPRRIGGRLPTGDQRTLRFAVRPDEAGTYRVRATVVYTTANGTERTITRRLPVTIAKPNNPGNLTLTGLDFSRSPNGLQISGTAANPGGTDVSGALVRVLEGETAGPAATQSKYFLGTVESSDFVSFDVNARVDGNATSVTVPLQVQYVVDGVTRERTITVTYSPTSGPGPGAPAGPAAGPSQDPAPRQSGGGLPLVRIVVGLAVVGAAVYGGRRLLARRG